MQGYNGYLQADGYKGYDTAVNHMNNKGQNIILTGCFAHTRRKFTDAIKANPKSKNIHSNIAIKYIARLYKIESEIKELHPDEKYKIRQEEAKPS